MLIDWHERLMLGERRLTVGAQRTHTEPVQVVSGRIEKEKVDYEALASADVPEAMRAFIGWFHESEAKSICSRPKHQSVRGLRISILRPSIRSKIARAGFGVRSQKKRYRMV